MTIKQQGGIFGRNPTFNNVDVDGSLDVTGETRINNGNLLVGKTASNFATDGIEARSTGQLYVTETSAIPLVVRRNTSDGEITKFYKDSTAVATIGTSGGNSIYINGNAASVASLQFGGGSIVYPSVDNVADIGANTRRFKSIYLSEGVYVGGTGAANLFDDYEEGTFSGTKGTGTTYSGTYIKVGRLVHVNCVCTFSSASTNVVADVPFAASSTDSPLNGSQPTAATSLTHFGNDIYVAVYSNGANVYVYSKTASTLGTPADGLLKFNFSYISQ